MMMMNLSLAWPLVDCSLLADGDGDNDDNNDDNFKPIFRLALSAFPGAWLTTGLPLLSKCRYSHCFGRCQEPFYIVLVHIF